MTNPHIFTLFSKLPSSANLREHWSVKHKRDKMMWSNFLLFNQQSLKEFIEIPNLSIHLIRGGKKPLDDDNLAFSFKVFRDHLSSYLYPGLAAGRADEKIKKWAYSQEISKAYFIRVEISLDESGNFWQK